MDQSAANSGNPAGVLGKLSRRISGFSIALAILLIVCGFLAILLPIEMSFGVVIVLSWLLMFSGILQLVHIFRCQGLGHGIWTGLMGVIYFLTGLYLRFNLGLGVALLTLVLLTFFVVQGLINLFLYARTRKSGVSGWLLLDGLISLVLGLMIWRHWPSGSLWVVGTLVGINMIMTGTTRLIFTIAIRRALKAIAPVAA